jgi:glutamate transport system substrate-binding protein
MLASLLCGLLLSSCIFGPPDTTKPTPTPTESPTPTRPPRLELSTYQYALQTKGKIRVAIRDAAPPMSMRTPNGSYEGFEADLAREIAKAIWGAIDDPDTHIEWIALASAPAPLPPSAAPTGPPTPTASTSPAPTPDVSVRSNAIAALTAGRADIAFAGLVANDETKKLIDLSDPYLHTGQRLLVKRTNDQIKEISDVASGDQTVCAIKGSVWEQGLRKITNDRAKILELDTQEFCLQALANGAADAYTSDELVLFDLVAKDPSLKVVGNRMTDDLLGIGMKKSVSADRQGFRDFANTALLKIVADRTWARLYEKYVTPISGDKKQLPTD